VEIQGKIPKWSKPGHLRFDSEIRRGAETGAKVSDGGKRQQCDHHGTEKQ